jgi:hypothetical protein
MNRLIHRSWGEGFVAQIYLTHWPQNLWMNGSNELGAKTFISCEASWWTSE